MKYDLRINDSLGNQLEVLQELPDKGDQFPTVVLVPGFGMDLHEYGYFDDISDALVKNGFQTFRFSFSGTGKSSGDFVETIIDSQVQQLHDVLSYVKKDRFRKGRVGILAQSFGVATTVAALPLPGVRTFVFTSSLACPYQSLARWFKRQRGFRPEGISEIERSDKRKTRVGPEFWTSLTKHSLPQEIEHLKVPVLFIHGSRDDKVKAWEAQEYYDHVRSRKKFQVIERANHAFTGKYRPVVLDLIKDWFMETLS